MGRQNVRNQPVSLRRAVEDTTPLRPANAIAPAVRALEHPALGLGNGRVDMVGIAMATEF